MAEPTIFDLSVPGRKGVTFPDSDVPETALPEGFLRDQLAFPEMSEMDAVRHFTSISQKNYAIDLGFYPLGSCTMKFNPKINEVTSRYPGFACTHPLQPIESVQGNLYLMYTLQEMLKEIAGFAGVTLMPSAGAQGEMVGTMIIHKYHHDRGDHQRTRMLIPDSAHGTNPASSAMLGFEIVPLPSDSRGNVDLEALRGLCDDRLAGLMLTNPNTLGLFDENVAEVIRLVHQAGGLVYGDGANMNALLGVFRPGDVGIDVLHFNLHKTFSTPHGGGGPGSGPVAVQKHLLPYLPDPIVGIIEEGDEETAPLYGFIHPEKSIGRIKTFYGHFGVMVRAFTYISMLGQEGLRDIAEMAVLNATTCRKSSNTPTPCLTIENACTNLCSKDIGKTCRGSRPGYRQTPDGLRLPSAHKLLPAHRPRSAYDRADGDREQRNPGSLCGCHAQDCRRSQKSARIAA